MKLVICEKNIAAKRIAYLLSNGSVNYSRMGRIPIYEFTKDNEKWTIIGLKGHIIALDYPVDYNQWTKISPRNLIDVEPCKKVSEKDIGSALKSLVVQNPFLIIATDYDREGELIGVEVVNLLKEYNENITDIKRAKFSAITKYEIIQAFNTLSKVDYNLSNAGEARQIIDLAWGAVLTRFISLTSRRLGRDFLSIGRVQSPTLALLVEREKEIQTFESKSFWKIIATLKKEKEFEATHQQGQFWEQQLVEDIFSKIKDSKQAIIAEVKKEQITEYPPSPFSTTSFLQTASYLGFPATKAMSIAEELYMNGLISYPRTDNTVYPRSLNLNNIVQKLTTSFLAKEAQEISQNRRPFPTRGKKQTTDHPPIHPVDIPSSKKLNPDQQKIYELICRRFLATLAKDALAETSEVTIDINNEHFKANGYTLLEANWKTVYPYIKENRKPLPELQKGDSVTIVSISIKKDKTRPPKRYTQGALIAKMEQLSLGTKSTRHEIIKKLYSRKYIVGSTPAPTSTAIAVIDSLKGCNVVEPQMTALLEQDMTAISEGKKTLEETVAESRRMLTEVIESLEQDKEKIKTSITSAHMKENHIGTCPKCGKDMIIRNSRKGERFVGCSNFPTCRNAYPLPQKGMIEKTDKTCDACNAPIIQMIMKGKKRIELCLNPRCPKVADGPSDLIGKCPKCGSDMIIRASRSGDRFVGCTNFPRCKNTYSLPKTGDVVTTDKVCDECKAPLIQIKRDGEDITTVCLNSECPSKKNKK